MTLLKSLPKEQQIKIVGLLDKEIELLKQEKEITKTLQKKITKRIAFMEDLKKNRQSLENLAKIVRRKKAQKNA